MQIKNYNITRTNKDSITISQELNVNYLYMEVRFVKHLFLVRSYKNSPSIGHNLGDTGHPHHLMWLWVQTRH